MAASIPNLRPFTLRDFWARSVEYECVPLDPRLVQSVRWAAYAMAVCVLWFLFPARSIFLVAIGQMCWFASDQAVALAHFSGIIAPAVAVLDVAATAGALGTILVFRQGATIRWHIALLAFVALAMLNTFVVGVYITIIAVNIAVAIIVGLVEAIVAIVIFICQAIMFILGLLVLGALVRE